MLNRYGQSYFRGQSDAELHKVANVARHGGWHGMADLAIAEMQRRSEVCCAASSIDPASHSADCQPESGR